MSSQDETDTRERGHILERERYDTLIIGPLSLDIMIDYEGNKEALIGGAVIQSGYAAANTGNRTAIFTKLNNRDADVYQAFAKCSADIYWKSSAETTSIRNQYFTEDKEKRECYLLSACDGFEWEELPPIESKIYHFAGLTAGDFPNEIIKHASEKGKVAVDVQCLLRKGEVNGEMKFYDWAEKKEYLPYIDFLKTDAAEAEILTGLTDREKAAKLLYQWGAKEVMITHNTEVLVYDGEAFWLEDKQSTNGTYVGDEKITGRVEIQPGQLFRIGRTWLRVEPATNFVPLDADDLPF